jgi:hypothetical protein
MLLDFLQSILYTEIEGVNFSRTPPGALAGSSHNALFSMLLPAQEKK